MKNWVHDLPLDMSSKQIFLNVLKMLSSDCRILEIGTFVGGSILNMMKVLSDRSNPNVIATVIDLWDLSEGEKKVIKESDSTAMIENAYDVFLNNIKKENRTVEILKGDSNRKLLELLRQNRKFDFIYIDGSHMCLDVHFDAILAWELLEKNGILGFDDYIWSYGRHTDLSKDDPLNIPKHAIDHFLNKYRDEYVLLSKSYRIFIMKK